MKSYDCLLTCSSWEERFMLSTERILEENNVKQVVAFNVAEFLNLTELNHEKVDNICADKGIEIVWHNIYMKDDVKSWNIIEEHFKANKSIINCIIIDITTMPRFLIWFILHQVTKYNLNAEYIYYPPDSYPDTWLSRDPGIPRLVLKHSGIAMPGRSTLLALQTGFDVERASQLIILYEPEVIILFAQTGEQFDNINRNLKKHEEELGHYCIYVISIDAFSGDHGMKEIESELYKYKEKHNVIMCSLGPKSSAIALYKININNPEYALCYVPSNEYNENYSTLINYDGIQYGVI